MQQGLNKKTILKNMYYTLRFNTNNIVQRQKKYLLFFKVDQNNIKKFMTSTNVTGTK